MSSLHWLDHGGTGPILASLSIYVPSHWSDLGGDSSSEVKLVDVCVCEGPKPEIPSISAIVKYKCWENECQHINIDQHHLYMAKI